MQPTISLKAYALRMNIKGKPAQVVFRNEIVNEALAAALDLVRRPRGTAPGSDVDRLFAVDEGSLRSVDNADRHVFGRMRAGTSGFASEIIGKSGEIAYNRSPTDTEVIPYHFFVSIPKSDRTPIICIQQSSGNGVYLFFVGILIDIIKKRLRSDDITVSMNPIFLSGLYISQFFAAGTVKQISAVAHRLSSDKADDAREARIQSEISLSPIKQKDAIATVRELLSGPKGEIVNNKDYVFAKVREIFELNDFNSVNELTIEAELNGVRRKISIGDNYGTAFEVTNEVIRDRLGHPSEDSMYSYMSEFVERSIRPYYGAY